MFKWMYLTAQVVMFGIWLWLMLWMIGAVVTGWAAFKKALKELVNPPDDDYVEPAMPWDTMSKKELKEYEEYVLSQLEQYDPPEAEMTQFEAALTVMELPSS